MACQSCAERRAQMKAYLAQKLERAAHWAKVRAGNGIAGTDAQAATDGAQAPADAAEGAGQAGTASAAYGQQGMAVDPHAGAGTGQLPMPRVRKARGGKGSAR